MIGKKIASSSHFVLFTTKDDTIEQWIELGRTLERMLLCATEMGISHAYLNQPNEEKQLTKEMAQQLQIPHRISNDSYKVGLWKANALFVEA